MIKWASTIGEMLKPFNWLVTEQRKASKSNWRAATVISTFTKVSQGAWPSIAMRRPVSSARLKWRSSVRIIKRLRTSRTWQGMEEVSGNTFKNWMRYLVHVLLLILLFAWDTRFTAFTHRTWQWWNRCGGVSRGKQFMIIMQVIFQKTKAVVVVLLVWVVYFLLKWGRATQPEKTLM